MVHFSAIYIYNGVSGVELPARSRGRARESGGEAESFEAIVHLKEAPKPVKTLMQSKYCAVMIHWSQSWGPQSMVPPSSSLRISEICLRTKMVAKSQMDMVS